MSFILLEEQTAPATPGANKVLLYPKADGKMYSKDDLGNENAVSVGPAASTDNAVARYDGTSGILQNSGVTIDDSNKLATVASVAGSAGVGIPHGTAPTAPVNGDIWTTTAGIFVRINGATVGPLGMSFASGIRMLFQQTAAPTGWTKEVSATYDDAALRFTTGVVGTGGADAFNTLFGTAKSTAGFTLTIAQIPAHVHPVSSVLTNITATAVTRTLTDSGSSYSSGSTGGGGSHAHTLNNMNLKFVDCIVAAKD